MTSKRGKSFAAKHGQDAQPDPILAEEIQKRLKNETLPCAVAFDLADRFRVSPSEVGKAVDLLDISLSKCQLGLFGYLPDNKIVVEEQTTNQELVQALKGSMQNDRLHCEAAWRVAEQFKINKLKLSNICQANGIKIKFCQLGAF